ncbi:hypothetical protein [Mesonia aquimarina]|uniref:hypothetical protein n=1 Tax=Mesonia aquimarina TaxID=1504967 RepID=UPI000EF59D2F|nr:hypothetical protein [Mesonia aquimarina]
MSQLTANSVLPIVSSLPQEEQRALLQKLQQMVEPVKAKSKSKSRKTIEDKVAEQLGEEFRPENIESLAALIALEN